MGKRQRNSETDIQNNSNSRAVLQSRIDTLISQKENLPAETGGIPTHPLASKIDDFNCCFK